jgi:hypothetical protein
LDCCGIKEYHKRNETCDDGILVYSAIIKKKIAEADPDFLR